jgi:hypothetical protein
VPLQESNAGLFPLKPTRLFIKSVRAMFTSTLAAIAAFEVILLGEDDVAFFGVVEVFGV